MTRAVAAARGTAGGGTRRGRVGVALLIGAGVLALLSLLAVASVRWPGAVDAGAVAGADAVLVHAGDGARFEAARELAAGTGVPLAVSWVPGAEAVRDDYCAEHAELCFTPEPSNTRGEARGFGRLADANGWDDVVVVTSREHLARARVSVRQCVDARVRLVDARPERDPPRQRVTDEAAKLLGSLTLYRAC